MRQYLKKNVFRIVTFTLLICLLPVSATAACASNKKEVYTEIVTIQPAETSYKNTETEKAVEAAKSEAIAKAEEAVKSAQTTAAAKSNSKAANTTEATKKPVETAEATKKAADTTKAATSAPQTTKAPATSNSSSVQDIERQVVALVNQARKQNGLNELTLNEELSNVARVKANDMANNKYFSHTSPTYGSPFDMMKQFGISYRTAGENIAMGQTTAQQVFDGWMNSEGHRANILNSSFTQIGVGYSSSGHYWAQMFIG